MAQDTDDLQHGHLYDIARQAQEKAVRARRRKLKRTARPVPPGTLARDAWRDPGKPGEISARQQRGMRGEDDAAQYLRDQGLLVLARNIHCRTGEIDLIATDRMSLIFIEVRVRSSRRFGGAAASVNTGKQRRLIRTAQYFLPRLCSRYFAGRLPPCRFDVISIENDRLTWIKHAFEDTSEPH